jgi:TonB family protein
MKITRALGIAIAVAVLAATPVAALAQGQIVTQPDWLRKPSQEDLYRVIPAEAARRGLDGTATIACLVNVDGALYDCKVATENPPGVGFGPAGLALAPAFQMRPMTRDGKAVAGGTVRIPINWKWGGGRGLPSGPPLLGQVAWRAAPTLDQVLASYPKRAREEAKSGRVQLMCTYTAEGRLKSCETTIQEPRAYGFADAAKTLAQYFQGPPLDEDVKGKKILATVMVTYASETLSGGKRVGKPKWVGLPTADAMAHSYPPAAFDKRLTGRVTLACVVQQSGGVGDCTVAGEDPDGQGFGEAALKMAPAFKMSIWTDEGLPTVGGEIRIPIRYQVAEAPADDAGLPPAPKP